MQGGGSAGKGHRVFTAQLPAHLVLNRNDVGAFGGDPVGVKCFLDIFHLIAMLGGSRKPNLFFECLEFQVLIPLFIQTGIVPSKDSFVFAHAKTIL
jgi:hypothetical protein